ncbi:TetR family transcriptional regulator [Pseudomonas sp. ICMP 8385]|uniref:TetR/AcrR family transcriptional regulator n=1 Tax=Pseudomonas TaxID=286 RepID=UPI000C08925F|nr:MULTISPECIES: TetR/AcrR family transcriptional regulator [Pseudomonas]NNA88842.1 TetR/AcrR family transcriptional regulator [Pseudomonas gessardii]PHN54816.1 TetR family transcriptional regulator [Pseudomonas sp. ICMP 8385]
MAGRPREFDREAALQRAMLLFWEQGYEGTSMSALVAALGIASARIYAAFGSKQALFREAVALYESGEGGFADCALAQTGLRSAIRDMLEDAITTYTQSGRPGGCLVVSAASSTSPDGAEVQQWLREHRRQRTQSIIDRLHRGQDSGELGEDADVQALGDFYATFLHGISIQARDGVAPERLRQSVEVALSLLPTRPSSPEQTPDPAGA